MNPLALSSKNQKELYFHKEQFLKFIDLYNLFKDNPDAFSFEEGSVADKATTSSSFQIFCSICIYFKF